MGKRCLVFNMGNKFIENNTHTQEMKVTIACPPPPPLLRRQMMVLTLVKENFQ